MLWAWISQAHITLRSTTQVADKYLVNTSFPSGMYDPSRKKISSNKKVGQGTVVWNYYLHILKDEPIFWLIFNQFSQQWILFSARKKTFNPKWTWCKMSRKGFGPLLPNKLMSQLWHHQQDHHLEAHGRTLSWPAEFSGTSLLKIIIFKESSSSGWFLTDGCVHLSWCFW